MAATILASSLAFIDGSVVNVALPAINRSFSSDTSSLQWVINGYLLPLSALLLLGGAGGDRFGRRRLLEAGIVLFALASVVCALAPTLSILLVGRLIQGVGAAMLMPNSLAILGGTFQGEAKGRAIGIWAAVGAMAGAVGPVLGGWLIDLGSWRAIFLLNLPIAIGAIFCARRGIAHDGARQGAPLDWLGGVIATAALGALTWALTVASGRAGWTPLTITATVIAMALGVGFLWVERQRGERAMMPLALFGSASFVGLSLLTFTLYGALGALIVLIPYVLIEALGFKATAAGAALLPFPLVLAVTSPVVGRIAGRIGPRWPLTLGPLGVAAGFLLMLRVDAHTNYWMSVFPAVLVMSLGLSGAVAPLTTAVLSSVDAQHTGSASGFNSAIARTGGLVATALLGSVLAARGDSLIGGFHTAMMISAAACIFASGSAFWLLRAKRSV